MPHVRINLRISADKYLAYYKGTADTVLTHAADGRRVRFPARVLRPFLTHDGIYGEFLIRFNDRQKFIGIEKVK